MINKIKQLSQEYFNEIIEIRRHLHQYPELSFQEYKTSIFIKSILNKWNIEYIDGYAETGIVVIVKGNQDRTDCIALRSDFDALPILEENDVAYSSKNQGIMHACGHDVHTACMLGSLKILHYLKDSWHGTVKFIFQPAEERIPGGAKRMIEEGVLKDPDVSHVIAQHVFPDLEVGKVGFCPGKYMASTDEIYVSIIGKEGHAALPDQYNNPIIAAADLILSLNNYFNKKKDLPSVFAIGFCEAKGSTNIIPKEVKLMGTFRAMNEDYRRDSHQKMLKISSDISKKFNLKIDYKIKKGYPVLTNDNKLTGSCVELAKQYMGAKNVVMLPIRMTAEDFSYFSLERPSCFYRLGVANLEKGIIHGLHTPKFDVDEECLKIGMGLMSWIAVNELMD